MFIFSLMRSNLYIVRPLDGPDTMTGSQRHDAQHTDAQLGSSTSHGGLSAHSSLLHRDRTALSLARTRTGTLHASGPYRDTHVNPTHPYTP